MASSETGEGEGGAGGDPDADLAARDREVLADLRRSRRRQRTTNFDPFEALYRAYITGIVSAIAVWLLSGVVGDTRVSHATVANVGAHGAAVVGMAIGLALALGARSGGRGGPLVIEAADVRHVLLSPVDRAQALRGPAIRQLRFGAAVGTAVGAIGGLLAFRRLPGDVLAWLACGAATGALSVLGGYGLAMLASGRRLGRYLGSLVGLGIAGWSAADLVTGSVTSPATFLGELALWPLRWRAPALIGPAVVALIVVAGLASVGGTSIEAAERRATLVGQIRFAATLRDLRTVVVLRRQLSQELPRQRPWVRLPRSLALPVAGQASRSRRRWFPVWRRGWHGILRFPAARFVRLALCGGVAGAALVGVWRGTTPLLFVAALALYIAGLDVVEPIAQELDHPDRTESYTLEQGVLLLRSTGPSIVLMIGVGLVGLAVAVAVTGGNTVAASVGGVLVVPAALCAVAGAAISVVQGPPPAFSTTDSMLPPEMAGVRAAVRTLLPPLVVLVGVLPLLAGRHPVAGESSAAAVGAIVPPVLILVALVAGWVRYRVRMRTWWTEAMREAGQQRRTSSTARRG